MSNEIPESIPTSQDPRSKRPTKRRALTPLSEQANQIQTLFKNPERDIRIPPTSKTRTAASLAAPPEIVANVQGSSAGAGSGEFHVYKASRRREYERVKLMEEETERENGAKEFERQREEKRRKDEEKTEKNRKKREKRKKIKGKKGKGSNGVAGDVDGTADKEMDTDGDPRGDDGGGRTEDGGPGVIIHDEE